MNFTKSEFQDEIQKNSYIKSQNVVIENRAVKSQDCLRSIYYKENFSSLLG